MFRSIAMFVTLALAIIVSVFSETAAASPPYGWNAFPAYAVNLSDYGWARIPSSVCPVSALSDVDGRSRKTGRRVKRVTFDPARSRYVVNAAPFSVRVYVFCG